MALIAGWMAFTIPCAFIAGAFIRAGMTDEPRLPGWVIAACLVSLTIAAGLLVGGLDH